MNGDHSPWLRSERPLRIGAATAFVLLFMVGALAMLFQWGSGWRNGSADAEMLTMLLVIVALGAWVIVLLVRARQQELTLLRIERERDRLFHFSLDLLAVMEPDGKILRCNAAFPRVLGYTERMLRRKSLIDLVHSDDLGETMTALRQLSSGEAVEFVVRVRSITGEYRWLSWRINPVNDEDACYAIAHDITRAKQTEEALQAEMAFRRAMEDSLVTGLRAIDLQGRIIYVNSAFCRLVGFGEAELLGCSPPFPYWPEESIESCWESLRMTLSGRFPPQGFDMRIRRKDGERLDARFYLSALIDGEGRHTGWMAAVTDVTEARRVRAALEAAQRRFAAVLEGLDAAVFVADWASDEILFANRAFKRIYGFDAVGQSAAAIGVPRPISPEPEGSHPDEETLPRELFDGEVQHPESGRWYHVHEQLSRWVDGRIVRMAIATDITVHQHLRALELQRQVQLHQTARLITMGEMASTLAHELNQPLAAIANYCRGGMSRLEQGRLDEAAVRAVLEKAATQAERAGSILNRIRDFVRKSEPLEQFLQAFLGAAIGARHLGLGIDHQRELAGEVVDDGELFGDEQQDVGRTDRVGLLDAGEPRFDVAHRVVAEVTHEPAEETRQPGARRHLDAVEILTDEGERIAVIAPLHEPVAVQQQGAAAIDFEAHGAGEPDHGVAPETLAALHRFEQVAPRPVGELEIQGERRVEVAKSGERDRDAVVALRREGVEFGFLHGFALEGLKPSSLAARGSDRERLKPADGVKIPGRRSHR